MSSYQYDERVVVNFDGTDYPGEIDAIDFAGDPEKPYRVWYDMPRTDWDGQEIECEWVKASWLSHACLDKTP